MYQEATDTELDVFCALNCLDVGDSDAFKGKADQKMRKLIHAISERKTLENYTPAQIATAAEGEGFQVTVVDDRLVFPYAKADEKALIHFFDNGIYHLGIDGVIFYC